MLYQQLRSLRTLKLKNCAMFCMHKCLEPTVENENDEVVVKHIGEVMTIGLNRPDKKNCVNRQMLEKMSEAFRLFESDDAALIGVLYGNGGNFCAGYNLEDLSEQHGLEENSLGVMVPIKSHLSKPIIAAVSGYALGGGFELALMCDLRVMEETAIFGFYNRRFGLPSVNGGTTRLQAMVGLSRALDIILTGRAVKSDEAFACGLANRVVACGTALGQAINLANSIKKFPQVCMAIDRASTYYASYMASSIDDALNFERHNAQQAMENDCFAGAAKFVSGIRKHGEFKNISNVFSKKLDKSK